MRASLCVVLALGASLAIRAQAPAPDRQQPTFRGGINYVRVDMHATRNGEPVTDLRSDEVDVFEDGKPQEVRDFEHVQVRTRTPQESRIEPTTVEESRQLAADPRARVFVIFLDTYHTQIEGSANMRTPLVKFIDRLMGPDDLVGVMTPEMAASDITLGRKTTVISNMMQREWTWGRRGRLMSNDPKDDLYAACYPAAIANEMKARRREKLSLDALEDLVLYLQGVRDERKAILTVSEGWVLYSPDRTLAARRDSDPVIPGISDRVRRGADRRTASNSDMTECEADRYALSELNDSFRMRQITETANRNNVTFYPVYPRGLAVFDSPIGPDAPPPIDKDLANLRGRQESLRTLASDTDGTAVINTNDIEAGMSRIVADLSSYYMLGYDSTNNKLDGKFRSISVRVKRPGVQVRARKGYRGLTAEEVVTRTDRGNPGVATANVPPTVVVNPRAPFRMRASVWSRREADAGAKLWLVGELDFATRKDLAWSNGATAEVSVVSASGDRVASLQVPFTASDGGFIVQVPAGTRFEAGDYAVRVRLTPQAGQALPLADLTRVTVAAAPSALGDAVMLRRGISTGPRFVATADPRFQKSDRLRLEIPTRAEGAATARLLDRSGRPLQVPVTLSERRDESGDFRWIVAEATLAPLAPGEYATEVKIGDALSVTPFRMTP